MTYSYSFRMFSYVLETEYDSGGLLGSFNYARIHKTDIRVVHGFPVFLYLRNRPW